MNQVALTRQSANRIWIALAAVLVAGALIVLPIPSAVAVVGGALALLACARWNEFALYALILAIPYGSWFPISIGVGNLTAADFLAAFLLLLWLARMIARERAIRVHLPPLALPFAIFLAVAFASFTVAASYDAAAKEWVKWLEMFALYVWAANNLDRVKLERALGVFLIAGLSEAAIGIYQFTFRVGPPGFTLFERFMRAYGTFEQPNPYAGYLALIIPIAFGIAFWFVTSRTLPVPSHKLRLETWGLGLAACVALAGMLAALAMSWSRGAWFGMAAALIATVVAQSRRAFLFVNVGALLLAAIIFLGSLNLIPDFVTERFAGITDYFGIFDVRGVPVDDANFAVVERMAHWQVAADMLADHPWLGVGFGNYAVAYPAYALPHWSDPLGHAHNYLLNVAAETGIAGALAYVLLWGAAFWQSWRAVRGTRGLPRAVAAGVLGTLIALIVQNSFDNLFVHSMQMQVGMGLGIVAYLNWARDANE
ncbi:MAG: O-antigen ligase family protein [Chloroflexi bacterium]|nr:O-antigen ligase family protein [Chloroflexota bacterium]